jgi:dienelactone hydrolase
MKRRTIRGLGFLWALMLIAACSQPQPRETVSYEFEAIDTVVSSRGVDVPVTYVRPLPRGNESFPLVVMAHGHGGTRNEAGGYTRVAEGLAKRGVATIRMDFPGCGESSEPFTKNNLGNMLEDIQASRDFTIRQPNIDASRVGLLGFSMGGRLVILTSARDSSYKAMATWAPAGADGISPEVNFLGGPEAYKALRAQAADEGLAPFTTRWGQDQQLGLKWFTDMEQSFPLESIKQFSGPLLVLYGDMDDVVPPRISEAVISAAVKSPEVVRHIVKGADHGLGLYSHEYALSDEVVSTTVDFLSQRL